MIADTIPILTDSTLIESVHLIANDTLVIKVQQVASSGGGKSSILDYVLKNGITIIMALLAGLIALYQVKSNVISNARMKWMEELRTSLSELCDSAARTLLNYNNYLKGQELADKDYRDDYDRYMNSFSKFNILRGKVKLLLDPDNDKHIQIEELINDVSHKISNEKINITPSTELSAKLASIIELSKQIFKEEWKRSKKVFKL